MSEQQQITPAQQQLANIQAAVSRQLESLLDATNMIRDIPKIFAANQALDGERNAANAKVAALEAKVAEQAALIEELEARLAALAPRAVNEQITDSVTQ